MPDKLKFCKVVEAQSGLPSPGSDRGYDAATCTRSKTGPENRADKRTDSQVQPKWWRSEKEEQAKTVQEMETTLHLLLLNHLQVEKKKAR